MKTTARRRRWGWLLIVWNIQCLEKWLRAMMNGPEVGSRGRYRLWRQDMGVVAFASVELAIEDLVAGPSQVRWSVERGDRSSAQPENDPVEVEAASRGVREVIDRLGRNRAELVGGLVVGVTKLEINLADTEPTAVQAAAAAATADLFGVLDRVEVVYEAGWRCRWLSE
ncbi:hypothetical protein AB0I60_02755 [Actinosynnema sp. NPDC050436]|uniref:hypothetical protein n=1 Tax=Actinosynnema sp. NPDC050436 TaxID=3155659 RepID=UPI0033D530E0